MIETQLMCVFTELLTGSHSILLQFLVTRLRLCNLCPEYGRKSDQDFGPQTEIIYQFLEELMPSSFSFTCSGWYHLKQVWLLATFPTLYICPFGLCISLN
ncbi:hypothetical protein CRYUN_Cryun01aG0240100 [Craigia yunnanensis]